MKYKKSAILLAGGQGLRLNRMDKNFLEFKGRSFFEITLEKLKNFSEIIVISNAPQKYVKYDVKVLEDEIKGIGPLGGILTGLKHSTHEECLILSCDTPFIKKELIDYQGKLAGEYDIAIPIHDSYREPLCALYKKSCLNEIEKCIEQKEFKIAKIFKELKVDWIEVNKFKNSKEISDGFLNINTFKDLELMKNM